MKQGKHFHFNSMESKHTFDISSFVTAYYFTNKPRFDPHPEQYDFSQIFLILEGQGSYEANGQCYKISPGCMIYRPAGKASIYRWSTDKVRFGIISFVCSSPAMQCLEGAPIFLGEEERYTLLDVIRTGVRACEPFSPDQPFLGMRYKDDTPAAVLDFIRASLERFLCMLSCRLMGIDLRHEQSEKVSQFIDTSGLVKDVEQYLSQNLSRQLDVAEICNVFGVGQTTLMKKFRAKTQKSVMEYFTDLKIRKAKQMIRTSSASFARISESLGFSSPNYFSKVFKQKTGMSPTEYSRYVSKYEG